MTVIDRHLSEITRNLNSGDNYLRKEGISDDIITTLSRSVSTLQAYAGDPKSNIELLSYLKVTHKLIPNFMKENLRIEELHYVTLQNSVLSASLRILIRTLNQTMEDVCIDFAKELSNAELYIYDRTELIKDISTSTLSEKVEALIQYIYLEELFEYAFILTPLIADISSSYKLNLLNEFVNKSSDEVSDTFKVDTEQVKEMLSTILA